MTDRLRLGGVIGPVAFIGAWLLSAAATSMDYSSIDDAISRLAAVGADTRWLMTAGFVVFGLSLPAFGVALRRDLPGRAGRAASVAAVATGIATLGVAATPLDWSSFVDALHGGFATVGYITLVAVPTMAFRPLRHSGCHRLAIAGAIVATVSATSLVLTLTDLPTGLVQRFGLTATDLWIVAAALELNRGRAGRSTVARGRVR